MLAVETVSDADGDVTAVVSVVVVGVVVGVVITSVAADGAVDLRDFADVTGADEETEVVDGVGGFPLESFAGVGVGGFTDLLTSRPKSFTSGHLLFSLPESLVPPDLPFTSFASLSFSSFVSLAPSLLLASLPPTGGMPFVLKASDFCPNGCDVSSVAGSEPLAAAFSLATAFASLAKSSSECSSKEWKQFLHRDFLHV